MSFQDFDPSNSINTIKDNISDEEKAINNYQKEVQRCIQKVSKLRADVNKVGTAQDSHALRGNIRTSVDEIQLMFKETNVLTKQVSALELGGFPGLRAKRDKLAGEYIKTVKDFGTLSQLAATKEKTPIPEAAIHRQKRHMAQKDAASGGGGMSASEMDSASLLEDARRQQLQQVEEEREYIDGVNLERAEEVRQLERSVMEINEMFRDLAGMVQEQGVIIDTIESNTAEAAVYTEEGVKEIDKAAEYQKKSRKKMIWILVCAVVILIAVASVIIIPIVVSKKKK